MLPAARAPHRKVHTMFVCLERIARAAEKLASQLLPDRWRLKVRRTRAVDTWSV